ncbi:MAG: hypothetical protein RIG68_12855 [Imperialibacter sp.]|uniref:hypothetical protein n=1 Tax=Imperialibacter sp. TaxID=2038411 RepID=UPI0032EE647B
MIFKELIERLSGKSTEEKILFTKLLLSGMTIMNRAIGDDNMISDKSKVETLKWSNELAHRIWNVLFELERGNDDESASRVAENIKFYQQQSGELAAHLNTTIKATIDKFNHLK